MTVGPLSRTERFRLWLAGHVFALSGRIHPIYDVWLDDALPRKDRRLVPARTNYHKGDDVERL